MRDRRLFIQKHYNWIRQNVLFHSFIAGESLTKFCSCVSCENLTLITNLHRFVWGEKKKKNAHFWPTVTMTCPSVPIFNIQRMSRTTSWPSCRVSSIVEPYVPILKELSQFCDFRRANFTTANGRNEKKKKKRGLDFMSRVFPRSNWFSCVFSQNQSGHQVCVCGLQKTQLVSKSVFIKSI